MTHHTEADESLRYPIGRFEPPPVYDAAWRSGALSAIQWLPRQLELAVQDLDQAWLHTPYRPGGWTPHQVVHHVADSHMQAYTRFKLGLTEDRPVIKAYAEEAWARLPDVKAQPLNVSLTLLHALHLRWVSLLEQMSPAEDDRVIIHPEHGREIPLKELIAHYAWHGRHHLGHILLVRNQSPAGEMQG